MERSRKGYFLPGESLERQKGSQVKMCRNKSGRKPAGRELRCPQISSEKTSKRVGKIASQQLRSKSTSKKAKSTAASALTQRPDKKKRKK